MERYALSNFGKLIERDLHKQQYTPAPQTAQHSTSLSTVLLRSPEVDQRHFLPPNAQHAPVSATQQASVTRNVLKGVSPHSNAVSAEVYTQYYIRWIAWGDLMRHCKHCPVGLQTGNNMCNLQRL